VYGPAGGRITAPAAPPERWPRMEQRIRLADTEWTVEIAYQPVDATLFRAERIALWASGLALAFALALVLFVLRRTIAAQRDELGRRRAAEDAYRRAADEAKERAAEARELAVQLEAAQRAAQQLSTSLSPDDVVDLFLGGVAEILDADAASLYTFEDDGDVVVGRRRIVFRDAGPATEPSRTEEFHQIRAPIALLPVLAEAVATGEPYVLGEGGGSRGLGGVVLGPDSAAASVTVPLLIGGRTVGVATWEVYRELRSFPAAHIAFAQALAAPAAAALRTAELFASLEAERARTSREALRFATVLDQMADGVIVVDRAGRVERSNQAAEELLGEGLADTPVERWPQRYDLVTVEGRPIPSEEFPLVRAMRGERIRRATFIVRSAWGTERHLSGSAGPILGAGGEPAGAALVIRDVSDEHQYAEMLRHTNRELRRQAEILEEVNQQLREATKAKDQFLAVMSHELRTPINAIMGYSDLLDLGIKGELNEEQRGMVSRVRDTSRHLLGLINEVLDLAKIGAGRMDLVLVELDAASVIDRAVQQVLPIAAAKGLHVDVVPPRDERRAEVLADETRLTQIIINLLSNAVKFTHEGGIRVSFRDTGDYVEICIRDSGPGIPPDQQERVFEEFYQVEGGLARSSGGTGLGLAIARRFARLMGGDITVQSQPGEGAEFVVTLPAARGAGVPAGGASQRTVALLVHDDSAFERAAQDLAGQLRVIGGSDTGDFYAATRRALVQLAAVDALAPDLGAWRALLGLLDDARTARLPVLLFARADEAGETAVDIGRFRMLEKPLDLEVAANLIVSMAGRSSAASVLIFEEDADTRRNLSSALTGRGAHVHAVANGSDAIERIERAGIDVAVLELMGDGVTGIEVLAQIRADPTMHDVPVVMMIGRDLPESEMERLHVMIERTLPVTPSRARPTATLLHEAIVEADAASRPFAGARGS
jgi:PAS domain S-box-containing protein